MPGTDRDDPYEVLGVGRHASASEIRDAYRRLANEVHPDRRRGSDQQMASINEAYRVLRDPARRGVHDARLRTGHERPSAPSSDAGFGGPAPAAAPVRLPWRAMVIFAAAGSLAVVVASQVIEPPDEPVPDNVLGPGSCVVIEPDSDAREVNCTGSSDTVVQQLVGFDESCPYGTDAHRDRQGMGWACVSISP